MTASLELGRLQSQAKLLRESLAKAKTTSDNMIQVLGSFDARLLSLEAAIRPAQMRTQTFRTVHENMNSTLRQAEIVISQFDVARQMEPRIREGPARDLEGYLAAVDRLQGAVDFFSRNASFNSTEGAATLSRALLREGISKLEEEFRRVLASQTKAYDPKIITTAADLLKPLNPAQGSAEENAPAHFISGGDIEVLPMHTIFPTSLIPRLNAMAKRMITAGAADNCIQAYRDVRGIAVDESLRQLGVERLAPDDIFQMQWEELEGRISSWIGHVRMTMVVLFAVERRLCDAIMRNLSPHHERCFAEVANPSASTLLSFGEAVAHSKESPEKLFVLLDMYEIMRDLIPQVNAVFSGDACLPNREAAAALVVALAKTAKGTFTDFEVQVRNDTSKAPFADGAVHPLTSYVINYTKFLCEYDTTLQQLFEGDSEKSKGGSRSRSRSRSRLVEATSKILTELHSNLENKSKMYRDAALTQIFLMNNTHYMVRSIRSSNEAKGLLGEDWVQRHRRIVQQYATAYQRTAWQKALLCLNSQGLSSQGSSDSINRQALKDRFKAFNTAFEELYMKQTGWIIPEPELRGAVQLQVAEVLLPAYRSFLKHKKVLEHGKNPGKYLKYSVEDLEKMLGEFFEGRSKTIPGALAR